MTLPIARRTLVDRRRAMLWWILGLIGYAVMILAVYPTIRSQPGISDIARNYPSGLMALFGMDATDFDLAQSATFLNTYLFSAVVPLIFVILGASRGAAVLAGQEEAGLLDLVLSYPVSRRRFVIEQFLEVVAELVLVGLALFVTVVVGGLIVGLDTGWSRLGGALAALVLLGAVFAGLALAVGAGTGHKGLADGVAAGVGVASYLVASLAAIASWLEPFRYGSPFWYATDAAMTTGVTPGRLAVLAVLVAVTVSGAVVLFERRSISR